MIHKNENGFRPCESFDVIKTVDGLQCGNCLVTESMTEQEKKELPYMCPLCKDERTELRQQDQTYIWVCPSCPFVGMEYYNDANLVDLDHLLNRVTA